MPEITKVCTVCGKELPLEAFAHSRTSRAKYNRHGECKKCTNAKARERRKRNPQKWDEVRRDCHLRWTFGISQEDYDRMFMQQNGRCAICGQIETAMRLGKVIHLAVDHNRKTGKVRELLCRNCNVALGHLHEDVDRCQSMAVYIRKHKKK